MKNTHVSSNRLNTNQSLDSRQAAASFFQAARREMEPSTGFWWEFAARAACGMCVAASLWVGVSSAFALHQSGGTERFVAESLRSRNVLTLEQSPVAANTPAPARKSAPAYL